MSADEPPNSGRGLERRCARVALALVALLVVPAALYAEATCAAWDAVAQALCAQRVVSLPGGIFVAGTDQKGPLFTWLYVVAWGLAPSSASYWYVIGAFTVAVAGATAEVVRRLVLALGGAPAVALGAALLLFVHLTFGEQEYCRLLYSRNVTGLLTALALLLALRLRSAGRPALVAAASGTSIGWAMQTMPTSALPAGVVALAVLVSLRAAGEETSLREALRARWRVAAAFCAGAVAPLVLVPLWYGLRGELADFWVQWWTCNLLYNRAIPVSASERPAAIAAGLAVALGNARYLVPLAAVGVALVVEARPGGLRAIGASWLVPLAWFVAECAQVSMTLRFFGHYFVLTLLPLVVLGALAASRLTRGAPPGVLAFAPLLFVVYAAFLTRPLERALSLTRAWDGLETGHEVRRRTAPPAEAEVSALLDVVSERDEVVYLWARDVTSHALFLRRSPTRYVENRWLTGEVFVSSGPGPRDERWVLPGVPENWARDVEATPPLAVVERNADPIRPDSPIGRWRAARYETVFERETFRVDLDPARWDWVEGALARARERAVPVTPGEALSLPDLGDARDATVVCFAGPGLALGGLLFEEEGDALTIVVYGAEGPTALAEGWAQDPPPHDDAPGELSVLLRGRAAIGVRGGRVIIGRLLYGARRLRVRVRHDARVTGAGVAQGLRPPWASR